MFRKEKYLFDIFFDGYRHKNLSFILEDKGNTLICQKIKLRMGHFSNIYYCLEKILICKIVDKFPKKEYLLDYIKEANSLKQLDRPKFFHKLINSFEISNLKS